MICRSRLHQGEREGVCHRVNQTLGGGIIKAWTVRHQVLGDDSEDGLAPMDVDYVLLGWRQQQS